MCGSFDRHQRREAEGLPVPGLIHKDESIYAVMGLADEADRRLDRSQRLGHIRMAGDESSSSLVGFGLSGPLLGGGLEQVAELGTGADREELERVGDDVDLGSISRVHASAKAATD